MWGRSSSLPRFEPKTAWMRSTNTTSVLIDHSNVSLKTRNLLDYFTLGGSNNKNDAWYFCRKKFNMIQSKEIRLSSSTVNFKHAKNGNTWLEASNVICAVNKLIMHCKKYSALNLKRLILGIRNTSSYLLYSVSL